MIKITECPRDAMQGIEKFIPTSLKVKYINALLKVGFDVIDFGSFVSPKAIPQLKDTAEVLSRLDLSKSQTKLLAIVANERGAHEAGDFDQIDASTSEMPDEHKSFNLVQLRNGQFALYPNNRCRIYDTSMTPENVKTPDFKVSTKIFEVENDVNWGRLGDCDDYFWTTPDERESELSVGIGTDDMNFDFYNGGFTIDLDGQEN